MRGKDMGSSKDKKWIVGYLLIIVVALLVIGGMVVQVDPFFHYGKPKTDEYFYTLSNERSQNDGISKNFDYDALITGTSMTQNFKTSEADKIFGTSTIKVAFSGGSYKEINDNVAVALKYQSNLKTIIRGLDMGMFMQDKDNMRLDLGSYPTYLYDDNPFNDVKYIYNKSVLLGRVVPMIISTFHDGFEPGITSFDDYSNWMASYTFGINAVCPDGVPETEPAEAVHLSEEEKQTVLGNIEQNVISLPAEYPDVTFYYFFTPYSAIWWQSLVNDGTIYKQIEAEQLVIEEILKYDNIKLYSFNGMTDIITDINNYKDSPHYGEWVNSLMLYFMKNGTCLLTADNYNEYLADELSFYTEYDYSLLRDQVDYDDDYEAEQVIREKYLLDE
jgi:hypothetical protein